LLPNKFSIIKHIFMPYVFPTVEIVTFLIVRPTVDNIRIAK
jgi:hypothetical protein